MYAITKFSHLTVLIFALLTVLQFGIASAFAVACCTNDCDRAMLCYGAPCHSCAPLPIVVANINTPTGYLIDVFPIGVAIAIPQGNLADIWRPPRMIT